jgi:hypothetical protein
MTSTSQEKLVEYLCSLHYGGAVWLGMSDKAKVRKRARMVAVLDELESLGLLRQSARA